MDMNCFVTHVAYDYFLLIIVRSAVLARFAFRTLPREPFNQFRIKGRVMTSAMIASTACEALQSLGFLTRYHFFLTELANIGWRGLFNFFLDFILINKTGK